MVISLVATTLIVSGLAYAATTITSTSQTVVNNDIMSAAWFNDVNSKLANATSWQVPSGAIMAFNLSACPTWWIAANGANGTPDLRWEFIRWLDSGRGVDSGRALRSWQGDAFASHSHNQMVSNRDNWGNWYDGVYPASANNPVAKTGSPYDTSSVGGSETRPRNVALLYCQKE